MTRPLGVSVAIAFLLFAIEVRADDTHYRSVPIGAHAIGLGGAFAGVADDASAAYFNPAGLALGGTVGLAGGLSINAWDRFDLRRAIEQPDGTATATAKTGRTVPIFIGAALKFGPKDALEQKKFALALSVVEPIFSRLGVFLTFPSDPVEFTDTYRFDTSDRATWYGLSFASRLNLKQSIGASLYLSVRRLNHNENGLTLGGGTGTPDEDGGFLGVSSAANIESLAFKAYHFVLRFGWLYRFKPQLQLGVMLQLPGIPLKQTVNTVSQSVVQDNSDPSMPAVTYPHFSDGKVGAHLPLPGELEVGLEYWPAEQVMLAFDASINSPVRSGQRVERDAEAPTGGAFFDDDTARRFIGNVAVAGDFYIGKKVMIEAGFFTDLSAAVSIPDEPQRYYAPQVNRLGGTLSLGLDVAGVSLAVGSTFIYGKGSATGVILDAANLTAGYTRTEATSRSVFLHLTGATQAATDLGNKTARGIKKRLAEKERREAEEAERRAQEQEPNEGASESH